MQQPSAFVAITVSEDPPDAAWSAAVVESAKGSQPPLDLLPRNYEQLNWQALRPEAGSYVIGMPATLFGALSDGTVKNLSATFDPLGTDIARDSGDAADLLRPLAQAPPNIRAIWLQSPMITGTPIMEVQAVDFKRAP
jgi:hypothetical protein